MVTKQSLPFLPGVFRTKTNRRFLNATVDQLLQEPLLGRLYGFVGRQHLSPAFQTNDPYVKEADDYSQYYQLEPSLVVRKKAVNSEKLATDNVYTYLDTLNAVSAKGGISTNHSRMFEQEYYNFEGFVDLEKMVNFGQYYWAPNGPDSVQVTTGSIITPGDLYVHRPDSYVSSDTAVRNALVGEPKLTIDGYGDQASPKLTLIRGQTYTFHVGQLGHPLWIQTEPGLGETSSIQANVLKTQVFGVDNNGVDSGTITFKVPQKTDQDYFENMTSAGKVDLVTDLPFNQIQNQPYLEWLKNNSIDGVTYFKSKTVVLTNQQADYWYYPSDFEDNAQPYDDSKFDQGIPVPLSQRKGIWLLDLVGPAANPIINLTYVSDWAEETKLFVNEGRQYGRTSIFKNTYDDINPVPNITAPLDTLYYQDGSDAGLVGIIELVEPQPTTTLDINGIIGRATYTSPNGVVFTNGLKVRFTGLVSPASYATGEYMVEGVGKAIQLLPWSEFITPETYNANKQDGFSPDNEPFDTANYDLTFSAPTQKDYIVINRASQDRSAWSRGNRWFHHEVLTYASVLNNPSQPYGFDENNRAKRPIIEYDANLQLFNNGVRTAGSVFVFDTHFTDALSNVQGQDPARLVGGGEFLTDGVELLDGITIIFANDADPKVRNTVYQVTDISVHSNKGFQTTVPYLSGYLSTKLYVAAGAVSSIQIGMQVTGPGVVTQDANGNSDPTYVASIGSELIAGNTAHYVILTNQLSADVQPGSYLFFAYTQRQVQLTPIKSFVDGDSIVVTSGLTQQGNTYHYQGGQWLLSQQKISTNQSPMFDVFDAQGISFSDISKYPSNTFSGSQLFGYAINTATGATKDAELGVALTYRTLNNVGDIVFQDYYQTDTFHYNQALKDQSMSINGGFAYENQPDGTYRLRNGWIKIADRSKQLIERQFVATLDKFNDFDLDCYFINSTNEKNAYVFVNGTQLDYSQFRLLTDEANQATRLQLATDLNENDQVIARIAALPYSQLRGQQQINLYTIPKNLDDNGQNADFSTLTLGQIRNHLLEISNNSLLFTGQAAGTNNLRDIQYKGIAGKILQHSAGAFTGMMLMNNDSTDIIAALDFNRRSYQRFKDKLFTVMREIQLTNPVDARQSLDEILADNALLADKDSAFYYTDMLAYGADHVKSSYQVFDPNVKKFNLSNQLPSGPNYQAVLIYVNKRQLANGHDYTVSDFNLTIVPSFTLNRGDLIEIYEYANTRGCMIPATPSKMALYPKSKPVIFTDTTYITPKVVIQGHDGSITPGFGTYLQDGTYIADYRDAILLEYETRVYNNIKNNYADQPLDLRSVEPGAFRQTGYSVGEWTQLLSTAFLTWAGINNVDFYSNTTASNDLFSYNWLGSRDRLLGESVPGYWRGIYKYFYDTDRPHTNPWEMLGYAEKPDWWENRYGPAPWTGGNTVMWSELAQGFKFQRGYDAYYDPRYARPGLEKIIPVDEHGKLLPPSLAVLGRTELNNAFEPWTFGDQGPAETAWRRSSDYPFAVQIAWALARPAEYCGLAMNTRDMRRLSLLDQIVDQRTGKRGLVLTVTDDANMVPGLNLWLRDRLADLNLSLVDSFINLFSDLRMNLAYKIAGYSSKDYLEAVIEQASPASTNSSVLVPPENYQLVFTKSSPISRVTYSAVVVEKVDNGWSVSGFDYAKPYFNVIPSVANANYYVISVSNDTANIYRDSTNVVNSLPYGTVLGSKQQVVDFMVSYGRWLTQQGFLFQDVLSDGSTVQDWVLASKEFLWWNQLGFGPKTVISLTPAATALKFDNGFGTVDDLSDTFNGTRVVDSSGRTLQGKDYRTYREGTRFELDLRDETQGIHLCDIDVVQYEHTVVFDNSTVFGDVIYQPELGNRQLRIKLQGYRTRDWDGSLYAPGFLINKNQVQAWQQYHDYYRGDIISFKNDYYTALDFIPGSATFGKTLWQKVNRSLVDKQLIPNPTFNSQQFEGFYDIDTFDVNAEADQFGRHATGFQPRNYLNDMGLDHISQHKFYLGMIRNKGTKGVMDSFGRGELPYLTNTVKLDEQWAIRLGDFGGTDTTDTIELSLRGAASMNGDYAIELLDPNDTVTPQFNSFKPQDLMMRPRNFTKDIFAGAPAPDVVGNAGNVLTSEIKVIVFDVLKINNVAALIPALGEGDLIWIGADRNNDWNVRRITMSNQFLKIISVTKVNDQELLITTNRNHFLRTNDMVMIKNARVSNTQGTVSTANGFYVVKAAANNQLRIAINAGINITGATDGLLFKLTPVRFSSAVDFANFTPVRGWKEGDIAWVNSTLEGWQVLKNTKSWQHLQYISPPYTQPSDLFGSSIHINKEQTIAGVGAPGKGNGYAFFYGFNPDTTTSAIGSISPPNPGVKEFGASISHNDNDFFAIGAPGSYLNNGVVYICHANAGAVTVVQVHYHNGSITGRFGTALAFSKDGQWLYVGEPGSNKVLVYRYYVPANDLVLSGGNFIFSTTAIAQRDDYAYELPTAIQQLDNHYKFTGQGFNVTPNDMQVTLNNTMLVPYQDYTVGLGTAGYAETVILNINPGKEFNVLPDGSSKSFVVPNYITATNLVVRIAGGLSTAYTFYSSSNTGIVFKITNSAASSGSVLSFPDTTGITTGMLVTGLNVPPSSFVTGVTSSSVTISTTISTTVPTNSKLTFNGTNNVVVFATAPVNAGSATFSTTTAAAVGSTTLTFPSGSAIPSGGSVTGSSFTPGTVVAGFTDDGHVKTVILNNPLKFAVPKGTAIWFNAIQITSSSDSLVISMNPYYQYVTTLTDPNSQSGDQFGASVACSEDGRTVVVGSPNATIALQPYGAFNGMGRTTVFNRTAEAFVFDGKTSSVKLTAVANNPVVKVDGKATTLFTYNHDNNPTTISFSTTETFYGDGMTTKFTLINTTNNPVITVNGGPPGSYTFDALTNSINFLIAPPEGFLVSVAVSIPPADSEVVVETNHFEYLAQLLSPVGSGSLGYGTSVAICPNNCSIYVGAPGYNNYTHANGVVFRHVNLGRTYGVANGTNANPTLTPGTDMRINDHLITISGPKLVDAVSAINGAKLLGVRASINSDNTIRIVSSSVLTGKKLVITPGTNGNLISDLGLQIYPTAQFILSPFSQDTQSFGSSISVGPDSYRMVVGAVDSVNQSETTVDKRTTTFDSASLRFIDLQAQAGAAHLYEYQASATETDTDIGQFALAQNLSDGTLSPLDRFGAAVAISRNFILVGAPGGHKNGVPAGLMHVYVNRDSSRTWKPIRSQGSDIDSSKIDRIYIYDDNKKTVTAELPVIDPSKGRIYPQGLEQIKYFTNYDPAVYTNVPNSLSFSFDPRSAWGKEHVGQLWWDLNAVRLQDFKQGDPMTRYATWGNLIPSSVVSVYEWVESDMPPNTYASGDKDSGPLYTTNPVFTQKTVLDENGNGKVMYYFWVRNSTRSSDPTGENARLSALQLQNIIANLRSLPLPFAAVIDTNRLVLFNCDQVVTDDSILNITYKRDSLPYMPTHTEWTMFDDGSDLGVAQDFIDRIEDSLAGQDSKGRSVPDPSLPEKQLYGLKLTPRQSTFSDKYSARRQWIAAINDIFVTYPMALLRDLAVFDQYEAVPDRTNWDLSVANNTELSYVNLVLTPVGTRALVKLDDRTNGWTLNLLITDPANPLTGKIWQLYRVQAYDMRPYWTLVDWYSTGYNADTVPKHTVDKETDVTNLNLLIGDIIKVRNSTSGGWKLQLVTSTGMQLIGQQRATAQLSKSLYDNPTAGFGIDTQSFESQHFAKDAAIEIRLFWEALVNHILVSDLRPQFKATLSLLIDTIAQEFKNMDWLFKTSLVNINHNISTLTQIPVYVNPPQDSVTGFFAEAKPYHAKIKQYLSIYSATDTALNQVSDFDLPPFKDPFTGLYRAPDIRNSNDAAQLAKPAYQAWVKNHGYGVENLFIRSGGQNYGPDTALVIKGDGTGATAYAYVVSGIIQAAIVTNPGQGYTYATVEIYGTGNGGAVFAQLGSGQVRSVTTGMVFDRYTYKLDANVKVWTPNSTYTPNDIVISNVIPYRVFETFTSGTSFDFDHLAPYAMAHWKPNSVFAKDSIIIRDNQPYVAKNGITQITVDAGGNGYIAANPTIVVTGDGSNFNGVVKTANGQVTSVTILDTGEGFTHYSLAVVDTPIQLNAGLVAGSNVMTLVNANASVANGQLITDTLASQPVYVPAYVTTGSNVMTLLSASFTISNGQTISDTFNPNAIPVGTTIKSYVQGTTTLVMSNVATANANVVTGSDTFSVSGAGASSSIPANTYVVDYHGGLRVVMSNPATANVASRTYTFQGANAQLHVSEARPTKDITTTAQFSLDQLQTYTGGVLKTANDRIWSYYYPSSGMPGRDLPQLMKGLEYPGVNVLGPGFDQEPGFDVGRFALSPFDSYEVSDSGVVTLNGAATLDTIYQSNFTDSQLGIRPSDIITSGDGFVDTSSSHAPEELVPGRSYDAVDIRVRTIPDNRNGNINSMDWTVAAYPGDGKTKQFSYAPEDTGVKLPLGGIEKLEVIVDVFGPQIEGTDFTVDYVAKLITFKSAPPSDGNVFIAMIGSTGLGVRSDTEYVSDGVTSSYPIPGFTGQSVNQAYVKVDGKRYDYWNLVFTPLDPNNITGPAAPSVVFTVIPRAGSFIQIHLYDLPLGTKAYTEIEERTYTVTVTTPVWPQDYTFTLPESIGYKQPWGANMIVRVNGSDLVPRNQAYYTGNGYTTDFSVATTVTLDVTTISDNDIQVVVNGVTKLYSIDYLVIKDNLGLAFPKVRFNTPPTKGDSIVISNQSIAQFVVVDANTVRIQANYTLNYNDRVDILVYTNHDPIDVHVTVFSGSTQQTNIPDLGYDSYGFAQAPWDFELEKFVTGIVYDLDRPVNNLNFLYLTLNGSLLSPYYEYIMETPTRLRLSDQLGVNNNSIVVVRHFSEATRYPLIEFRMFKDIQDRFTFMGISENHSTYLTQALRLTDEYIYVSDASKLSQPDLEASTPGIVFVNGERITYWTKDLTNNRLGDLRRGTAGTGAIVHQPGTRVESGGIEVNIPNSDESFIVSNVTATKDSDGNYVFGQAGNTTTLVSKAGSQAVVNAGSLIRQGTLWQRPGVVLQVSDSVQAQFLRSL